MLIARTHYDMAKVTMRRLAGCLASTGSCDYTGGLAVMFVEAPREL
jgi:hypothetical protein